MHQAKIETALTEIMIEQGMILPTWRVNFEKPAPCGFDRIEVGAQVYLPRKRKPDMVVTFFIHEVRGTVTWEATVLR